jgi:hypothetical protein
LAFFDTEVYLFPEALTPPFASLPTSAAGNSLIFDFGRLENIPQNYLIVGDDTIHKIN